MTARGEGMFQISSWDEQSYDQSDEGPKLSQAHVTQAFSGAIEGTGSVRWLMCYRPDGTADWVGLQRIDGRIGDHEGSFVLQTVGTFDGAVAAGEWTVVAGTGTGGLEGLTGTGRLEAPMGGQATYVLDYEL